MHRKFFAFLIAGLFYLAASSVALAAGGACPSGAPVTGNNCYFIAANGTDTNNGTSEATPWLHAPGMPNCSGTCNNISPSSGNGFIFRGGDTWHFGNSSAAPYTGGTWAISAAGNSSTCVYEGTQSGCIYFGVDLTWYNSSVCGSSWCRPIMNGDNPTSTTTVSSCAYQIGSNNQLIYQNSGGYYNILDNLELLGLCTQHTTGGNNNSDVYIEDSGSGVTGQGMLFQTNLYIHGWTATTTAGTGNNALACNMIGGGNQSLHSIVALVVDGSDSDPQVCAWAIFPSFYHIKDSMIRYATQGVGQYCHDIHDNIFEHFYVPNIPTHGNILECNDDNPGNAPGQPQNTPNVVYNNIVRHDSPAFATAGDPHFWFCPESVPEYWFNNLMYDIGGQAWDYAGPTNYGCTNTGGQIMFNNTLVDVVQPCYVPTVSHGGQYLTVYNEHLINTPFDSGTTACTGVGAGQNIMTDATATAQGYTTGSGGTDGGSNTCANDATKPCSPTSATNGTVGAGGNQMAYCTALAGYSSEYAIGTEAANACKNGTTDGCAYNSTTHTMSCPGQVAVARPLSGAWDSGAYQFSSVVTGAPQAPTSLAATAK
jgi:hypothetical protein